MEQQIIYGRYEYEIGDTPSHTVFEKFRGRAVRREDGITVGGYDVAICNGTPRTAIILTYDKDVDVFVKLTIIGEKNIKYRDCLKEKLKWEAELERRKENENKTL
jgi:hypothetical protein